MVDKHSITTPIEAIVKDEISKIAHPTIVEITKVYNNGYVNVKNESFGELHYIRTITSHNVGDTTLLVFADNDYSQRIVI